MHDQEHNPAPQPNSPQSDDDLRDLLPAYSIGATDPDETGFVEAHLTDGARAELAEYRALGEALLYSPPPVMPPPALHDRLIQAAQAQTPTAPSAAPNLLAQVRALFTPGAALAFAALALVVLAASSLFWLAQVDSLNSERDALAAQLTERDALLYALGAGSARSINLAAQDAPALPSATMAWTRVGQENKWVGLVNSSTLPLLTTDSVYQVWLIRGEEPLGVGVMEMDARGNNALFFLSLEPIGGYDAVGITVEPSGGSSKPTSAPLVLGTF